MSTFGLSIVGRFVLFRSVPYPYQRFHCNEILPGQKRLAMSLEGIIL